MFCRRFLANILKSSPIYCNFETVGFNILPRSQDDTVVQNEEQSIHDRIVTTKSTTTERKSVTMTSDIDIQEYNRNSGISIRSSTVNESDAQTDRFSTQSRSTMTTSARDTNVSHGTELSRGTVSSKVSVRDTFTRYTAHSVVSTMMDAVVNVEFTQPMRWLLLPLVQSPFFCALLAWISYSQFVTEDTISLDIMAGDVGEATRRVIHCFSPKKTVKTSKSFTKHVNTTIFCRYYFVILF